MIISKANLNVVEVVAPDKTSVVLNNIHIAPDGSSVAGNGKAFLAVSPVSGKVREKLKVLLTDDALGTDEGLNVSAETTKEILKNMPKDRQYGGALEHAEVVKTEGGVSVMLYDGKRKRSLDGKTYPHEYAPYKEILKRAFSKRIAARYVVNAKRLIPLLDALVKVSEDATDFSPVYVEFSEDGDIILRMQNPVTAQRAVAVMWAYKGTEAKWMEQNEWERSITDDKPSPQRARAKRRGNKQLAHITSEVCPECGKYKLATDGKVSWCSCVSECTYFRTN